MTTGPSYFVILFTFFMALMLSLLPMPDWLIWLKPAWVLLILIYWAIMAPGYVGVGTAWILGLMLDLLNGSLLGEHALALTLVVYLVSRMNIFLRMYPLLQQGMSVFIFVLIYQFILYCIQGFIGELPYSHLYWLSSVTSTLLWPWLFVLMRDYCRRFNVV